MQTDLSDLIYTAENNTEEATDNIDFMDIVSSFCDTTTQRNIGSFVGSSFTHNIPARSSKGERGFKLNSLTSRSKSPDSVVQSRSLFSP
jgi:hypothetical protein